MFKGDSKKGEWRTEKKEERRKKGEQRRVIAATGREDRALQRTKKVVLLTS